jgi:filamentous hemagglutinin family protein
MQYKKQFCLTITFLLLLNFSYPRIALSTDGIATDGTLGSAAHVISPPNSVADVEIKQNAGVTVGHNLFHSFSKFNIESGQTVTFKENTVNFLDNVISRVTGGARSEINGILQSTLGGHADFYLISPSGVIFGKDANINVPASFHVSTADELNFKDGFKFKAGLYTENELSAAAPSAFGFLGTSIANNGLLEVNGSNLQAKSEQHIDFTAVNVTVKNNALLSAPNGQIRIAAIHGQNSISIDGALPLPIQTPSERNAGNINIVDLGNEQDTVTGIKTSGDGGGRVALWGNNIIVKNSQVATDNYGPKHASFDQSLVINSNNLRVENSTISSDVLDGDGGNITVNSNSAIDLLNAGIIKGSSFGIGKAGILNIYTKNLTINGANNPKFVTGISSVCSDTCSTEGAAGRINIYADSLDVLDGGLIQTYTVGKGPGGNINIGTNKILINSRGFDLGTGIFASAEQGSVGQAGGIIINTKILNIISDHSLISTTTKSDGNAGKIAITADMIKIDGISDSLPVDQRDTPGIESIADQNSSGEGGNITIKARDIDLIHGGKIAASTLSSGSAGSITIIADKLSLNKGGFISSSSRNSNSSGRTGLIDITAKDSVKLSSGEIRIINEATELDKNAAVNITPGSINIDSHDIQLINSKVTTESKGNVSAGSINLKFTDTLSLDPSLITTEANSGNGGNISIHGGELIRLQNSGIKTSVIGKTGNGGNININADVLLMETGAIQANTNAFGGSGGNINLNFQALIPSGNMLTIGGSKLVFWKPGQFSLNVIQAAAPSGLSGQIQSTAPQLNLSGELANLGPPQFDNSFLSQEYCSLGSGSSLIRLGKGGLLPKARDAWVY